MVTKYRPSPISYIELCDFLQYISAVEATFGLLRKASKSMSHLIKFAKDQNTEEWSLCEELCFNKMCSEAVRVMSQPITRNHQNM
jgi:hypothetical protein